MTKRRKPKDRPSMNLAVKEREPNGRHSRAQRPMDATSPAAIKRLKEAALRDMADEQWGTVLGHMLLDGGISEEDYAAGRKWAETVTAYYHAIRASPPYPKAISWERYEPEADADENTEKGKRQIKKARDAVNEMHDALGVLRTAGSLAVKMVREVCEENRAPADWMDRVGLRAGLSELATFWHLK